MNDREFWIQIRRGLIMVLRAIDQRYALNSVRTSAHAPLLIKGVEPESQTSQERISANVLRNR